MKFSQNGLYIESYTKCTNCGVLIYDKIEQAVKGQDNAPYCSSWCIDWKKDRDARRSKVKVSS